MKLGYLDKYHRREVQEDVIEEEDWFKDLLEENSEEGEGKKEQGGAQNVIFAFL